MRFVAVRFAITTGFTSQLNELVGSLIKSAPTSPYGVTKSGFSPLLISCDRLESFREIQLGNPNFEFRSSDAVTRLSLTSESV